MRFNRRGAASKQRLAGAFLALALASITTLSEATSVTSAVDRQSILLANSTRPFLLSASQSGHRIVAVGERGVIPEFNT